jgi:hypothetical protein
MSQVKLSPQTTDAIDRDVAPHLVGSAGTVLASLGALFQLLAPVLIKILQTFATSGVEPTAANVFKAGHKLTQADADPDADDNDDEFDELDELDDKPEPVDPKESWYADPKTPLVAPAHPSQSAAVPGGTASAVPSSGLPGGPAKVVPAAGQAAAPNPELLRYAPDRKSSG